MKWYSERAFRLETFSVGDTTAYGDSIDLRSYAGGALKVPSGFSGTLELQASHNDTDWAFVNDSAGNPVSIDNNAADTWRVIAADVFPLPFVRWVLTDGSQPPRRVAPATTLPSH